MVICSIDDIWNAALEECKKNVSEAAYNTFIKSLTPKRFDGNEFTFSIESKYMKITLENLYKNIITDAIKTVVGTPVNIVFIVDEDE